MEFIGTTESLREQQQQQQQQQQNNNGAGDGAGDNGSGDKGAGGGGSATDFTDADKQLLETTRRVFGDNPVEKIQQYSQFAESYKEIEPFIETARRLQADQGKAALLNYVDGGGTDLALFQELQSIEVDKLEPLEAVVRRVMFEEKVDRATAEAAMKFKYNIGDEYATSSEGERMALQIELKKNANDAKAWIGEFQQKTMRPQGPGNQNQVSPERVAQIKTEWNTALAANPFSLNSDIEVEDYELKKMPVNFKVENDAEILGEIKQRIERYAEMGLEPTKENVQAAIREATHAAIGKHINRLLKMQADVIATSFKEYIGEKFYGIKPKPKTEQNPNPGNKNGITLVKKDGQEKPMATDF